jgi:putative restriction endonuclease
MNGATTRRSEFSEHLRATNFGGSGKASSYLRALDLLEKMLKTAPMGFEDCQNLWGVDSAERLIELRLKVLEEQKRSEKSPWGLKRIPVSYLRNGYCSAALTQLVEFLTQSVFSRKIQHILNTGSRDEAVLAKSLNISPSIPDGFVYDAESKDGKERLQSIKARIGQRAFRDVILSIYRNRCSLTGIDLPEVNRASHIIGWAERSKTRMDPRNGICLSATYDAAFDRKLITFDDDFRLVLCKSIRDRVPSETLKHHFLSKKGQRLEMPARLHPLKEYLEHHRRGGEF